MIPLFPSFKPLEIEDKNDIESLTSPYPPYSDYYFLSMFIWNTDDTIRVSTLNGNLVLIFPDYLTGDPFLSFIGSNAVEQTINTLLSYAQEKSLPDTLKLLPEHNFPADTIDAFPPAMSASEDRDNFDYVLSVEKISTMSGEKLHQKRKMINHFKNSYTHVLQTHELTNTHVQREVLGFLEEWRQYHPEKQIEAANEYKAFQKLIQFSTAFKAEVQLLIVDNQIIGFSIFETVDKDYCIGSFQKGNITYRGVYEMLNYQKALYVKDKGCSFINIEQDLGIPGLRRAKLDYDPVFLKKYIIKKKT